MSANASDFLFKTIERSMRISIYFCIILVGLVLNCSAQSKNYSIDISQVTAPQPIPLTKLGGTNPEGEQIAVNNYYISRGGVPVIPITGEFHFTRYPSQYWDESLKKMKAGGINTVATYVFWNIHEEKEGVFDWKGDRDLRKFIELCKKNHLSVIVRIGPFDHGEIRNGGLPDWLLGKPLTVRSDDPLYLQYVAALYNEIGLQLKGLYYKDGGPIIGIQLENEHQHSASPWGLTYPGQPFDFTVADRDLASAHEGVSVASAKNANAAAGNEHMRTLKSLAVKAGMVVPIYTATGWGYAALIPGETLPVTAAYAYPTWIEKKELSPFYLYKDLHNNPDYSPVRYKPMDYPAFAAELGAGIMTTYSRRPIVPAESVDALINRCIGGGANGIGYYMYHGGTSPTGEHYFFSDEAYGYPKKSYDFQAPIGEYGQIRPSFNRLKLLHFFINDFADVLAPLVTTLPKDAAAIRPENIRDLRYAVRSDGRRGFLFLDNFQDDTLTNDHSGIQLNIKTAQEIITIPKKGGFTLAAGENLILPFHLNINGSDLIYATAQLMSRSDEENNRYYVFFTPEKLNGEFCFKRSTVNIQNAINCKLEYNGKTVTVKCSNDQPASFLLTANNGQITHILVISKAKALTAFPLEIDGKTHLIFSKATALKDGHSLELLSTGENTIGFEIYPVIAHAPECSDGTVKNMGADALFSKYSIDLPRWELKPELIKTGTRKVMVTLPKTLPKGLNDIFLNIDYVGDTGMGFLDGELVTDDFYKGIPWQIGLKRFIGSADNQMGFYFRPLMKNATYLVDLPAAVAEAAKKNDQTLELRQLTYTPEYKTVLNFK